MKFLGLLFLLFLSATSLAHADEPISTYWSGSNGPGCPVVGPVCAGVNVLLPTASVYQVASPTGSGTTCSLAAPCSLAQAQTNAQGESAGSRTIYLRSGTYSPSQLGTDNCSLSKYGPASIDIGASDITEVWATWPGDPIDSAIIDGGATQIPGISAASISGTTLTISGTVYGSAIATGQKLAGTGVTSGTTITGGSGTSWTVSISQTVATTSMYATNGLPTAVCIHYGNNAGDYPVTFYGLKLQNWAAFGLKSLRSPIYVQNNEFTNIGHQDTVNDTGPVSFFGTYYSQMSHNYVHDIDGYGFIVNCGPGVGSCNGATVSNNFFYNVCTVYYDCGAIATIGSGATDNDGTISITRNYFRDSNTVKTGGNYGYDIYHDEFSNHVTDVGNVMTGTKNAAIFCHSCSYVTATGNITDLNGGGSAGGGDFAMAWQYASDSDPMSNNFYENNIVVTSYNGAGGGGWYINSGATVPTVQNNWYFNYYPAGTIENGCTGGGTCGSGGVMDQNPVYGVPALHCYGAILSPASAVSAMAPAIAAGGFVPQSAAWDQPGFWGPVGFTMPETGTAPLWPTTSGDGVTCTNAN